MVAIKNNKRNVAIVELQVFERALPLVSCYAEAFASKFMELQEAYNIRKVSMLNTSSQEEILATLRATEATIFGFSCYVWNYNMVSSIVDVLVDEMPGAQIILGGPHVLNAAHNFLLPEREGVVICNGEVERVFSDYLRELLEASPDLTRVRGLSVVRDGTLIVNEAPERIIDLDEIPSPFLGGFVDKNKYTWTVFETNRGCPYECAFCVWGARQRTAFRKLGKFSIDRVKEDLKWLAQNGMCGIDIGDANWGILKRDIEISEHIVRLKERYGLPMVVLTNGAKEDHGRGLEITKIFADAGLTATRSIAIQSMNPDALKLAKRKPLTIEKYKKTQSALNARNLSAHVELIWPMPGETLDSFEEGINQLCELEAEYIIVYPLQLLPNTEYFDDRERFGFQTRRTSADQHSAVEYVEGTSDVTREEYIDGLWYKFAMFVLYNCRTLHELLRYLHTENIAKYRDVLRAFAEFAQNINACAPAEYFRSGLNGQHLDFASDGWIGHLVLHQQRAETVNLLESFLRSQHWWDEDRFRGFFELDVLNMPCVYSNTHVSHPEGFFRVLRVSKYSEVEWAIEVPVEVSSASVALRYATGSEGSYSRFSLSYRRTQLPYMPGRGTVHNSNNVVAALEALRTIMPVWSSA